MAARLTRAARPELHLAPRGSAAVSRPARNFRRRSQMPSLRTGDPKRITGTAMPSCDPEVASSRHQADTMRRSPAGPEAARSCRAARSRYRHAKPQRPPAFDCCRVPRPAPPNASLDCCAGAKVGEHVVTRQPLLPKCRSSANPVHAGGVLLWCDEPHRGRTLGLKLSQELRFEWKWS
jgi:hypothetical protein